jgi:hypothetical protein
VPNGKSLIYKKIIVAVPAVDSVRAASGQRADSAAASVSGSIYRYTIAISGRLGEDGFGR